MSNESVSIVRMRTIGVREWSTARLRSIRRSHKDRFQLDIEPSSDFSAFLKGTSVEVHLPLGGCFIATIDACGPLSFFLTITEYLDPSHCQDDLLHGIDEVE